jgi:prevent-host-death family protein
MMMIAIGEFRRNPGPVLDAVSHGDRVTVTRHGTAVADLVPLTREPTSGATPAEAMAIYADAPLSAGSWARDLAGIRADDQWDDTRGRRGR